MKGIKKIIIILSILIFLLSWSSVYAEDHTNENITQVSELNQDSDVIISSSIDCDELGSDDAVKNYIVNQRNFKMYFNEHNVLKDEYGGQIITFDGEFNDKGIITIGSPNTKITGRNTLFNNTAFCLESSNIILSNLNFVWDKTFYYNDYAGVLVLNDNNTIYNCNFDYTVPENGDGTCVYVECGSYMKVNGFNLINNTFNIIGNNFEDGAVYGVFLDWVDNPVIYGNTINAQLPLKTVDWSREVYGGARMDTVAAFAAENCLNLSLTNNRITTQANHRNCSFPTLDTVLLYGCHNAVVEGNYIYGEDYVTQEDQDNYLQGIDLYLSDNVTIINNQIHLRTTGGCENMGTAYPIQVTGPSKNVKIAYNNISSVNNGPNLGIYSQNFYGATEINVISNYINITGRANKHNWALVAGLEVQDSNDLIWNNTIIVKNVGSYDDNNNIYGISYSQNTNNNHTYNIQYNKIITNGRYGVLLMGSNSLVVDSIVANNMIRTLVNTGDDAVFIGNGTNNQVYNNGDNKMGSMNPNDLPDWLKNHRTVIPVNPNFNVPEGISLFFDDDSDTHSPTHGHESSNGLGLTNNGNSGHNNGIGNANNKTSKDSDFIRGVDDGTASKIGGKSTAAKASSSGGDNAGESVSESRSYEIQKVIHEPDNYILTIAIVAIALLLLIIGYKREEKEDNVK